MRVLVTGGAGFIGGNLCRSLVRDGAEVVVLDDLSTGHAANLEGVGVDLRVASILDPAALSDACAGVSSIVHLAARPSVPKSVAEPRRSHDINATGTMAVLEAARSSGTHLVISSSSSVYGDSAVLPKRETAACSPTSPYAASKLAAESYTLAFQRCYGLPCTVFRFFNVFGPLQDPDHDYAAVVPAFVWAALRGEPIRVYGDGDQTRDFTFVDSVTAVLRQAVTRRVTCDAPVNLAFGTRTTVNTLVGVLAELLGRRLDVRHLPARAGDVRHSQAATESLTRLFPDLTPVPLRDGLERTIGWMEEKMRAAEFTGASA